MGTYINWLIVAKRLRHYSEIAGNAITLPDFFSNRFHEEKKVLMAISSIFILLFFCVYASSCFVTCGKLFSSLFGVDYQVMMIVGAIFVVVYTFLGGFLAESASDFMQAVVMVLALVIILTLGTISAGGLGEVFANLRSIPGYLEFFNQATPVLGETGEQVIQNGAPLFGDAAPYSIISALSMLAWGLGYFGMPQVLLRFMAIRRKEELVKSRRIATVWVIISLFSAIAIGFIGRALAPTQFLTNSDAEKIVENTFEASSKGGTTSTLNLAKGTYCVKVDPTYSLSDLTYTLRVAEPPQSKDMYRLYNRWTGEHFYTASATERDSLTSVGWTYEGVGWVAPTSGQKVYRLYNPYVKGGDHHYTMDVEEYNTLATLGWEQEGVGWRSGGTVKVYRQYNPFAETGTHNYTTDENENDALVELGWEAEGVGWYAVSKK